MVGTKRLGGSIDDSLTKNRDDEVEAMLRRRKQLKTTTKTTTPLSLSYSASKMNWSKNDELVILGGIVDYENETELSYRSDWDAFYRYIKDSVEAKFSRKQLIDKVKSLKRKFTYNQGRSNDGEELSFTNTDDDEIFKLSLIIWAENETEYVSNENMDQAKDVPSGEQESNGVPCAEQERVSIEIDDGEKEKLDQAMDVPCAEQENKDVTCAEQGDKDEPCGEQEDKDVPCEEQEDKDVPSVEQERVSIEIDNGEQEMSEEDDVDELGDMEDTLDSGISFHSLDNNCEKEKSEEDGVVELGVLQEVLKADTFFQSLGRYQQKSLLQNLENIGAEKRKELIDEWKALFVEELQLSIKKLTFTAKLANGGVSP
ncbi:GLABROUS1 enhancer-binding protein family [Arabidopsis thaliana x Arabidopsis arenosa]|uniref:GLABROUS1 enhancer-binding protein family n=1 Tax=Arabidopsis thaliana x Arabidopsis arenosa TaxID=1240361 RepID=A0A8T2A9E2_9BRAS|nr:GLABROUS1 enhancer-binding protein family [Arabidopsis thaliana x Arabidopsis arenosa]